MHELLNVLYILTQGAILHLDHDAVRVEVDGETRVRVPLLRLSGIAVFGRVTVTSFLLQRCAEDGRSLVWLDQGGRFKARVEGPVKGNVLLRRAQHIALSREGHPARIARQIVAAKIQNCRQVIMRGARDSSEPEDSDALGGIATRMAEILEQVRLTEDLQILRGLEGEAARGYFGVFGRLVRVRRDIFTPDGRSRRPPRDRMNALLSFLYALITAECASALEGVGLDPQVGFLHALRSGRPALALDLVEEFRPVIADRLALTLVNRRQLGEDHFEVTLGGGTLLNDDGRRIVLAAYQKRKEVEVAHQMMNSKVPLGLVPHVQARLLARHLRNDLTDYPSFVLR